MRLKNKHKNRLFLDAVCVGDIEAVKKMLSAGIPVDARDNEHEETALMLAGMLGRDTIALLLIKAGADVNAKDATGRTPLMAAKAKCVPALLSAGAEINVQNEDGETALMKAAAAADIDKVMALLKAGADATISDHDGRSAWDRANGLGIKGLTDLADLAG